jgi:hypothetical protein
MSKEKTNGNKKSAHSFKNEQEISVKPANSAINNHSIPLLPQNTMDDIIEGVKSNYADYIDIADSVLTDSQRKRKVGAGNKNYGFIDKASDLAEANSEYVQFFRITDLKNCIRNVEMCRNLADLLMGFWRAVTNTQLIYSDDAYSMALLFYNNVKSMAKRGDPMARALADTMKTYFKKKKSDPVEPTNREILRDVKALERGTKDGKIVIENIKPHMTGGVHKVVDDIRTGHTAIKESDEADIKE